MQKKILYNSIKASLQPCPLCGIIGIHSCIDAPLVHIMDEENEKFSKVIKELLENGKKKTKS